MILHNSVPDVEIINSQGTKEFKMKASARSFQILSSGLYSNKIRAILRELGTNCVDSHVAAGRATTPFEVHLPTTFEPWFSIRDYGTGLDDDEVSDIYTTYFESTKTDSDEFIGALGLGSKSPFSYTTNFTITAIKNGIKRFYSAFINEKGVPAVAAMHSELTTELPGVEIKFSVTNKDDYWKFKSEASAVYQWFSLKPIITGTAVIIYDVKYQEQNIVPGIHKMHESVSTALMGNIPYVINVPQNLFLELGDFRGLLSHGFVIEFPIGSLDFVASREHLGYVPLTLNSIKSRLDELGAGLEKFVLGKIAHATTYWEKIAILSALRSQNYYLNDIVRRVAESLPKTVYSNTPWQLRFTQENLAPNHFAIRRYMSDGKTIKVTTIHAADLKFPACVGKSITSSLDLTIEENRKFIIHNNKSVADSIVRVRENAKQNPLTHWYLLIPDDSTSEATFKQECKAFLAAIGSPTYVTNASDLAKKDKVAAVKTEGVRARRITYSKYSYPHMKYGKVVSYTDDSVTYFYVVKGEDGITDIGLYGLESQFDSLYNTINQLSSHTIPYIVAITQSQLPKIKNRKNWVPFGTFITDIIAKYTTATLNNIYNRSVIQSDKYGIVDARVALKLDATSTYRQFYDTYVVHFSKSLNSEESRILALCKGVCYNFDTTLKTKCLADLERVSVKYDMLSLIEHDSKSRNTTIEAMVKYIKMVDSSTSLT